MELGNILGDFISIPIVIANVGATNVFRYSNEELFTMIKPNQLYPRIYHIYGY